MDTLGGGENCGNFGKLFRRANILVLNWFSIALKISCQYMCTFIDKILVKYFSLFFNCNSCQTSQLIIGHQKTLPHLNELNI